MKRALKAGGYYKTPCMETMRGVLMSFLFEIIYKPLYNL